MNAATLIFLVGVFVLAALLVATWRQVFEAFRLMSKWADDDLERSMKGLANPMNRVAAQEINWPDL